MPADATRWPADVRGVLARICRDVRIGGPLSFRLATEPPEMALSEVTSYPNEALDDPLVHALTDRLYARYYCRRSAPDEREKRASDMLETLGQANASRDGWDPGWDVVSRDAHGNVVVRSGGRTRLAGADAWRNDDDGPERLALQRRRDDATLQADYYYAYGETLGDRYEELVDARVYLNVAPEAAPGWTRRATTLLNAYGVPFTFKALRYAAAYRRVDTCIVYVPRRYVAFVAALFVDEAHTAGGLRSATPTFTRRLAPGIALADNPPGGISFGLFRMRLAAEAIVAAWHGGVSGPRERMRAIGVQFRAAGLDPRRPWLNPGNADFELPARVRSARAVAPLAVAPPAVAPPAGARADGAPESWIDVAHRIAARLVRDALWSGDECTWLGWSVIPGSETRKPAVCTAGGDLYAGTAGIALFLAHMARATGDARCRATALGALRHSARRSMHGYWPVGAYSGLAGLMHAALGVGESLGDGESRRLAARFFRRLTDARPMDLEVDVIEGRAGAIRALLQAGEAQQVDAGRALDCGVRYGRDLLRLATRHGERSSWATVLGRGAHHLLGYSHGAAGIACALADLHAATGEAAFRDGARRALNHEYAGFDDARKNWPDLRSAGAERSYMSAWCSGAPGTALALARLAAGGHVDARYLDAAVETTRASVAAPAPGERPSCCLCHGIAGNLEILLEIHRRANRPDLLAAVQAGAEAMTLRHHATGVWPCGIVDGGESPGLMLGLAGIGMFYLRLHDPTIASPLAL
jgi:hypothetical protein